MISHPMQRRQLLRSTSAVVALPFLESLRLRPGVAAMAAPARPKRMIFLGMGFGVTKETWYPDSQQTGSDWALPPGLQPLARHQRDLTIIQNLSNKFSNEAHWGSTFW
ncbi:MAG: DUF1552 domain-containing protein, partial [Pirellulaceae bacterium]